MVNADAIREFTRRCDELIAETEIAIELENENETAIYAYNLALTNLKNW